MDYIVPKKGQGRLQVFTAAATIVSKNIFPPRVSAIIVKYSRDFTSCCLKRYDYENLRLRFLLKFRLSRGFITKIWVKGLSTASKVAIKNF